jgi:hypothetical protein
LRQCEGALLFISFFFFFRCCSCCSFNEVYLIKLK